MVAKLGLAALLAVAGYAVVSAGSFALTQRLDPTLETVGRNRYAAAALLAVGGLALATVGGMPILGVALAAGGAVAGLGTKVALLLGSVLDKQTTTAGIGAVFSGGGQQKLGAVYGQRMNALPPYVAAGRNIGAVYGMNAVYGMGSINAPGGWRPQAPWANNSPFG